MKTMGIILLLVGALVLIYGGISYNRNTTVLEVGSLDISATEHKNIPIPAILGFVVLIGGAAMLVSDRRRS